MKTKRLPITISRKIDQINGLIDLVKQADKIPTTYAGGTFPHYVQIKPIEVKNNFVTIFSSSTDNMYQFIDGKERYNVTKASLFGDDYCAKHLN